MKLNLAAVKIIALVAAIIIAVATPYFFGPGTEVEKIADEVVQEEITE